MKVCHSWNIEFEPGDAAEKHQCAFAGSDSDDGKQQNIAMTMDNSSLLSLFSFLSKTAPSLVLSYLIPEK